MDLPLKKKTDAAPLLLNWHPNFRNYDRLPDIKVVRTAFFINTVAITIVVFFVAFIGFKEYQLHSLEKQLADAQARVDRDSGPSAKVVDMYKAFQAEEKRLGVINDFANSRPRFSEILQRLADTLPPFVALTVCDERDKLVTLRAVVRGAPDLAAGRANAYVELLRKDKELGNFFDQVTLAGMNPNPQDGRLIIELSLRFKTTKK